MRFPGAKLLTLAGPKELFPQVRQLLDVVATLATLAAGIPDRLGRLDGALQIRRKDARLGGRHHLGQVSAQPTGLDDAVRGESRVAGARVDTRGVVYRLCMADEEQTHSWCAVRKAMGQP